jgi:HlyD family secretion protein
LFKPTTILDRAKERLSESIVKAPIAGIILQKYVEKGQIIASGVSNVGGGTPIADIADMHNVHIEAGIDEIDIGKIQVGQTANVVPEAYSNLTFKGRVVRIAPEAKIEQNVTLFDVIIEVENTEGKLKSGMNATIEIAIVKKENILIAPATALKTQEGSKSDIRIALLKKGNAFVPQKVKIGLNNFKQTEILSGLKEGDILGIPVTSRLKTDNERLENRIRDSRGFGSSSGRT